MNKIDLKKQAWCAVIDAVHRLDEAQAEITPIDVAVEALGEMTIPEGATEKDAFKALHRIATAFLRYEYGGQE